MQANWLHKTGKERLIIFFHGWGLDANSLKHLHSKEYDVLLIHQYIDFDCSEDLSAISQRYAWIGIIAFSMGVSQYSILRQKHQWRSPDISIAINGTLHPVHNTLGIPVEIFKSTLDQFSIPNRDKFFKRMCGGADNFRKFQNCIPQVLPEKQKEELQVLYDRCIHLELGNYFNSAIISSHDLIFSSVNQFNSWNNSIAKIVTINGSHFPFFAWNFWDEIIQIAHGQ